MNFTKPRRLTLSWICILFLSLLSVRGMDSDDDDYAPSDDGWEEEMDNGSDVDCGVGGIALDEERRVERDCKEINALDQQFYATALPSRPGAVLSFPISYLGVSEEQRECWGIHDSTHVLVKVLQDSLDREFNYIAGPKAPSVEIGLTNEDDVHLHADVVIRASTGGKSLLPDSFTLGKTLEMRLRDQLTGEWFRIQETINANKQLITVMDNMSYLYDEEDGGENSYESVLNALMTYVKKGGRLDAPDTPIQVLEILTSQPAAASRSVSGLADQDKPSLELTKPHNLLALILAKVADVFGKASTHCMVCGEPLEFPSVKPGICSNDMCKFTYCQFNVGFSLEREIIQRPWIIDFLISIMYSAANDSGDRNAMGVYFPTEVDAREFYPDLPEDMKTHFRLTDADRPKDVQSRWRGREHEWKPYDYELVKTVLATCPKVDEMQAIVRSASSEEGVLKRFLKERHPLLYPLLVWCVTTNRAYFRTLGEDEQLMWQDHAGAEIKKALNTKCEFVFANAPPEKEKEFQRLKAEAERKFGEGRGSRFMWHGSSPFNWHAIVRTGLKNMSGTALESAGAALGPGIYFANNMDYSLGYATSCTAWPKSNIGSPLRVIALCEIVRGFDTARQGYGAQAATDPNNSNDVWVVQNEAAVIPRCLFVSSDKDARGGAIMANGFGGQACKLKVPCRALASAKAIATQQDVDAALARQEASFGSLLAAAASRLI